MDMQDGKKKFHLISSIKNDHFESFLDLYVKDLLD